MFPVQYVVHHFLGSSTFSVIIGIIIIMLQFLQHMLFVFLGVCWSCTRHAVCSPWYVLPCTTLGLLSLDGCCLHCLSFFSFVISFIRFFPALFLFHLIVHVLYCLVFIRCSIHSVFVLQLLLLSVWAVLTYTHFYLCSYGAAVLGWDCGLGLDSL